MAYYVDCFLQYWIKLLKLEESNNKLWANVVKSEFLKHLCKVSILCFYLLVIGNKDDLALGFLKALLVF